MHWKSHLRDLIAKGLTQAEIGRRIGIKQPTIAGLLAGTQQDVRWHVGQKLLALHTELCGSAHTHPPPAASEDSSAPEAATEAGEGSHA